LPAKKQKDYEYPGIDWRGSAPEDRKGFTKLCRALREAFDKESTETGNERLLLTAAVAGAKNTIDKVSQRPDHSYKTFLTNRKSSNPKGLRSR
jgi:GH18 family chitinase